MPSKHKIFIDDKSTKLIKNVEVKVNVFGATIRLEIDSVESCRLVYQQLIDQKIPVKFQARDAGPNQLSIFRRLSRYTKFFMKTKDFNFLDVLVENGHLNPDFSYQIKTNFPNPVEDNPLCKYPLDQLYSQGKGGFFYTMEGDSRLVVSGYGKEKQEIFERHVLGAECFSMSTLKTTQRWQIYPATQDEIALLREKIRAHEIQFKEPYKKILRQLRSVSAIGDSASSLTSWLVSEDPLMKLEGYSFERQQCAAPKLQNESDKRHELGVTESSSLDEEFVMIEKSDLSNDEDSVESDGIHDLFIDINQDDLEGYDASKNSC